MNKKTPTFIKRAAAWLMTLLMLVSQLAAPVAALATDVSTLPVISVNYTDWDGNPQSVMVYPAANGEEVVYWAQMPENINWDAGVTLTAQMMDGSYCPLDGTVPYFAVNAPALDGMSFTSNVDLFGSVEEAGGAPFASFPLYLSSAPMPQPEPEPEPEKTGTVYVSYQTAEGEFAGYNVDVSESNNVISPDFSVVPSDYTAVSVDPVTIDFSSGAPSPATVTFMFQQPEKTGTVYVSYQTAEGEFAGYNVDVSESNNVISPDFSVVPSDYTAVSVDPVTIDFSSGAPSPAMVTFMFQQPEKTGTV